MAYQKGSVYLHNKTWFLKYRTTELKDGIPHVVHKTHFLSKRDDEHPSKKSVAGLRDAFMLKVNAKNGNHKFPGMEMLVLDFWKDQYLPYCEKEWKGTGMKPATIRGFKQIWNQHLQSHFGPVTLEDYTPEMARGFFSSLKKTQSKNTLKHIRALGSTIFSEAIERGLRQDPNPWHVKLPKDCKESEATQHYTLEEAENVISALVDHVDCQLIVALSFFLGLRPGEIAGLKWEDFDSDNVHIRRSVVRGHIGTPKTPESMAPLPLIGQVRVPLELWRAKCDKRSEGWLFENRSGNPADLHNYVNRIIIPHVNGTGECIPCKEIPKKSNAVWKGLYAGRRGACTFAVEVTNGNYAVAQALLRHKTMTTTLNVYKKQITPQAFKAGMMMLEAAANRRSGNSKRTRGHKPLKVRKK